MQSTETQRGLDPLLLLATLGLAVVGLATIYSASAINAGENTGDEFYYFRRQLISFAAGVGLMGVLAHVNYQVFARLIRPALVLVFALLIAIYVPGLGRKAGGAVRWLNIAGFSFQPSELAKLALVIYLAASLAHKKTGKVRSFTYGFLPHALVTGMMVALVLPQPDFGTSVTLGLILFALLLLGGVKIGHLAACGTILVGLAGAAIWVAPYRFERVKVFLDPFAHRYSGGYQVCESMISIGSGGLWGMGLGEGGKKLYFLPEAHTDFIFSVIGEELGFIGIALVLLLFAVWVWRAVKIGLGSVDTFGRFVALGIAVSVGMQALFNMAVTMALLPTKGLTLPFLSYGRTSLLLCFIATGILFNVQLGGVGRDEKERALGNRRRIAEPTGTFIGDRGLEAPG